MTLAIQSPPVQVFVADRSVEHTGADTLREQPKDDLTKIWERIDSKITSALKLPTSPSEIQAALADPQNRGIFAGVVELDLSRLELQSLPSQLAKLSSLKALDISHNSLREDCLECLVGFPKLENLTVYKVFSREDHLRIAKRLTDSFSLKHLTGDVNLQVIYGTVRSEAQALVSVWEKYRHFITEDQALNLAAEKNPSLREIFASSKPRPSEIRAFFNTCIESQVYCFDSIRALDLKNFNLGTLPSELGCMRMVQTIDLSHNNFWGITESTKKVFAHFKELTSLDFRVNSISPGKIQAIVKVLKDTLPKLQTVHFVSTQALVVRTQSTSQTCIVM